MVHEDNYPAGYNAGYIAGKAAERERVKQATRDMCYFLGVAIDYIQTITQVNTKGVVQKMEQFREELRRAR